MDKFPRITLQIIDSEPQIIFESSEKESKKMLSETESLVQIFKYLKKELKFEEVPDENIIPGLLKLAQQGDERFIEKLPGKSLRSDKLLLQETVEDEIAKAKKNVDDYSDYNDVSADVQTELVRNQHLDILASILEMVYNIIIANVVDSASELGVGNIRLDDQTGIGRLRSKMAGELTKMNIELDIV